MATKSSLVLAAAVLAAVSFLAPCKVLAGAPDLMPTGPGGGQPDDGIQPFDPNPATAGSKTRAFLTYGFDSDGNAVPPKTLRITNNAAVTMYPIMRSPNTGLTTAAPKVAAYDPYDPPNHEYRGYIGYVEGGKYYFGLKPGQSILVSLPLVFWNGARIGVGTGSAYLTPAVGLPNPLNYDPNAFRSITLAETSGDTIPNGVVMWYRANVSQGPADDSEDQLAEWTIRDHAYLSSPQITTASHGEIPDNQLLDLINYDVSNVDSLYLPLALAANDVWLLPQGTDPGKATDPTKPNLTGGWSAGSDPAVFGWTGAINTIDFLQAKIRAFTAGNNALLGQYFGGNGWPFYNFPNVITDPTVPIKIPSGANIFPQSPMKGLGDRSSYDNEKYLLSSGGTEKIAETIASSGDQSGLANNQIRLSPSEPQSKIDFVKIGNLATPNPAGAIPAGTTVTAVDATTRVVTLSQALASTIVGSSVTFTRPKHDYAAEAMIKLWYSWAQYYLAHWKDHTPTAPTSATPITASNKAATATLTFNEAHPELVKGMSVTGPGLDNAQTEVGVHQGDAVILQIASDQKSVTLSQVMIPSSTNQPFSFSPPKALLWTPSAASDPGYPLIGDQFVFSNEPAWHDPYEFSQAVYLIMASMNQIGVANNDSVFKFLQDIVGANMGYIFNQQAKDSDDGKAVTSMIRDMIKSVLRGVSDFTKYPDMIDDHGIHTSWYPDPKTSTGKQTFNVYNLDPFVWFVHVQLGFSGYGFSVDDDTADVGAGGPSHLQLSITGTGGLKNTAPWTIQAPFGPVKNVALPYSGPASTTNGDTLYNAIASVSNTTPIRVTTPGQHHLANGDTVVIDQVGGDPAANGTFRVGNVTTNTFDLFDAATGTAPVAPTGSYTSGGRWAYPLHPYIDSGADLTKVFYRVTGDDALGTFLGTLVSVNGVDRNKTTGKKFRVWQLGRQDVGRLLLDADLTDANGAPLAAGTYTFTFFGVAETSPAPPTPPLASPPGQPNAAYLVRLKNRLDAARKIDEPEQRALAIDRLRAWMKLVRRGVDPTSREGRLKRQLVNARFIPDPARRQETVDRIKAKLEKLKDNP
jgi:hypothetical protein